MRNPVGMQSKLADIFAEVVDVSSQNHEKDTISLKMVVDQIINCERLGVDYRSPQFTYLKLE